MDAEEVLQSRVLGGIAVVFAAILTVAGIQQAAVRAADVESSSSTLAPLAVAVLFVAIVVLAGRAIAGARRTPYCRTNPSESALTHRLRRPFVCR